MADEKIAGSLDTTSFGRLLSKIWEARLTGRLSIHGPHGNKIFHFVSGKAAVTPDILPASSFGPYLVQSGAVDGQLIKKAAAEKSRSAVFLKSLLKQDTVSAHKIWSCAEAFFRQEIKALFSQTEDRFTFQAEKELPSLHRLFLLSIPELILEGSRGISDPDLIRRFSPQEEDIIHLRTVPALSEITTGLHPVETYVLDLIDGRKTVAELKEGSQLNDKDTEKIVFLLFNLGILEIRQPLGGGSQMGRLTPSDIKTLLEALNHQSMAIFRYISKEIGPVAQTVLDKYFHDAKSHISPLFQPVRLLQEGSLDIQPLLKKQALLTNKSAQGELLRGLNEILAAEILAVRKTLGSRAVGPLIEILNKLP
jgi:hypothetical protein